MVKEAEGEETTVLFPQGFDAARIGGLSFAESDLWVMLKNFFFNRQSKSAS